MIIRETTARLIAPDAAALQQIRDLPRENAAHDALMGQLPAMTTIERGGAEIGGKLGFPIRFAAWNLERCLFPQASADRLHGADVVLLSEMDDGMARSNQAHPTAEIAQSLGMRYIYGVEFIELGLGSRTERALAKQNFNARGLHGNAALSKVGFTEPFLLRLPGERFWFHEGASQDGQARLGERMAIGGLVATEAGPLLVISTHFESQASADTRAAQMAAILDFAEAAHRGIPFVMGGDLNSGNHIGGDWRRESFFDLARARGCQIHGGPEEQVTTRPSLISPGAAREMKLDWFITRGVVAENARIESALGPDDVPLSDHDLIRVEIRALAAAL